MKRNIIPVRAFTKIIDSLIRKNKLLAKDLEAFKKALTINPKMGDLIKWAGGLRKTRLKSPSGGKRDGFRVCYFDDTENEELFLLVIYPKNEQEDLTINEKKDLKKLINMIKSR